jgi:uncharacterized protein with FMN-binding domain
MRRVIFALLGTVVGTTLLVGLKAPGVMAPSTNVAEGPLDPATGGAIPGQPVQPGQPAQPGQTPKPGQPGVTPGARTTPGPTPRPGQSSTKPGPGSTTTSGHPSTSTTSNPPATRTITGGAYPAKGYGNMQVRITVTGTHIDSIATIQVSNQPKSTASTLTAQALSCQCVPTGHVSGATYSGTAWEQSLQSAIAQI